MFNPDRPESLPLTSGGRRFELVETGTGAEAVGRGFGQELTGITGSLLDIYLALRFQ